MDQNVIIVGVRDTSKGIAPAKEEENTFPTRPRVKAKARMARKERGKADRVNILKVRDPESRRSKVRMATLQPSGRHGTLP